MKTTLANGPFVVGSVPFDIYFVRSVTWALSVLPCITLLFTLRLALCHSCASRASRQNTPSTRTFSRRCLLFSSTRGLLSRSLWCPTCRRTVCIPRGWLLTPLNTASVHGLRRRPPPHSPPT